MSVEALAVELRTFDDRLPELLGGIAGQVGEVATFALVKGTDVIGTYASQGDAISVGYQELGNVPFLVKEITDSPRPKRFTRDI